MTDTRVDFGNVPIKAVDAADGTGTYLLGVSGAGGGGGGGDASAANQTALNTLTGAVTESAPASDTASSGLNGRLQRVAQRLTALIAQLPATLGQKTSANSLAVVVSSDQSAIPTTVSGVATAANQATELTDLGATNEAAPASDTAASGLNGRLQRIAQNITTLIGRTPGTLGQKAMSASFAVVVASDQSAIPTTVSGVSTEATLAAQSAKLPASLGAKTMATSLSITAASDQTPIPVLMTRGVTTVAASVAGGASLSGVIDLAGYAIAAIITDAAFDGAEISFTACDTSGGTYVAVYDDLGSQLKVVCAASRAITDAAVLSKLAGLRYIKIVTTTAQTGASGFVIVLKA